MRKFYWWLGLQLQKTKRLIDSRTQAGCHSNCYQSDAADPVHQSMPGKLGRPLEIKILVPNAGFGTMMVYLRKFPEKQTYSKFFFNPENSQSKSYQSQKIKKNKKEREREKAQKKKELQSIHFHRLIQDFCQGGGPVEFWPEERRNNNLSLSFEFFPLLTESWVLSSVSYLQCSYAMLFLWFCLFL